jgi:hypothetical protein
MKHITDYRCPNSGNLHKIVINGEYMHPIVGCSVEYECPDCKKRHKFKPAVWSGPEPVFPEECYVLGKLY